MKKRRILLALIMLIISGVSLTTATYAWFTANRQVTVDEIDVKASASGGIQISADAETWSNEVDLTDLKADGLLDATNYIPTTLKPVTTIGTNGKTGQFDFYYGELDESGNLVTLTSTNDAAKNYVSFDLYFYSATDQTIDFNEGTKVFAQDAENPTSGTVVDKGLKYSVRVGFLVQGNDPTATPATAKGLDDGTVADQYIWEPNANNHTTYATNMSGASGVEEYMGGKAVATDATLNNSTYFETVTSTTHHLYVSDEEADGVTPYPTTMKFNFKAGITKVRVYIWLEGQDVDNEDTASLGSGVGVKLNFKIADATTN